MRPRHAILVLALVAGLAGCGSGSNNTSSDTKTTSTPVTTPHVTVPTNGLGHLDCAKYAQTSAQISAAAAKMFTGTAADFAAATNLLKTELAGLKDGAPSDVKAAIDDLTSALVDIGKIRANPTTADQAHLQALAGKLPADGQKISAYVAATCNS